MARITLEPLRGFRDILEPESGMLTRLAEIFREIALSHGYGEVKPPTLERFELFAVKSGEEIRRSMYVFRDKAGREVALRPEATASVARIYLRLLRGRQKPIRLFYVVNCFRYEEPQRARYREFWQAGIEIIGEPDIYGDFEAIKMLVYFYRKIGMMDHIVLKLGSTRLYRILFAKYNVPEDFQDHILHLMDKGMYKEALNEINEKGFNELGVLLSRIWEHRDSIDAAVKAIENVVPEAKKAISELNAIYDMLRQYEPNLNIEIDLAFARGLAYYTGIIYEVKVPGFPVSIAGGGRYDNLIKIYGDEDVPGTGFAIGLDRTLAAMQELGRAEDLLEKRRRAALIVMNREHVPYAARIQDMLILKNIVTTIVVTPRLHKALTRIVKQGYDYAIIVGEQEYREQKVTIRDLAARKQVTVPVKDIEEVSELSELLA